MENKDEGVEIDTEEDEEMIDVEVLEFALNNEEIDKLIRELEKLKQTKSNFSFEIDEGNEMIIHHADEGEEDE